MTAFEILQDLITTGEFHHATYRNVGTLWEGVAKTREREPYDGWKADE